MGNFSGMRSSNGFANLHPTRPLMSHQYYVPHWCPIHQGIAFDGGPATAGCLGVDRLREAELYNVQTPNGELIGFTKCNPVKSNSDSMNLIVDPVCNGNFVFDSSKYPINSDFQMVTVRKSRKTVHEDSLIDGERTREFVVWEAPFDAICLLIRAGWIECLNPGYERTKRLYDRKARVMALEYIIDRDLNFLERPMLDPDALLRGDKIPTLLQTARTLSMVLDACQSTGQYSSIDFSRHLATATQFEAQLVLLEAASAGRKAYLQSC